MNRAFVSAALALAVLAGCGPNYSPDTYSSSAVQQASKVEQGVIAGVRKVGVQASGATGAVVGGAAGGIAGSQVPGGGLGTALTTLGGSLVGGLVGTGIERAGGDTTAFEYIVRKANGEMVSVTQKDEAPMALGQHVLVIAGSQARIVPDYTVSFEPPKPPEPAKPQPPAVPAPVTEEPLAAPQPVPQPVPLAAP
jgi:outer membrane lipoprotein SlyB